MAELGSPDGPDDMAEVLVQMENGSVMSRFYAGRRRPEKKTVVLKQGVFEIAWYGGVRQGRTSTAVPEGTVELREVAEVRKGKNSRDFEKQQNEADRCDADSCLVILYGNEFRLKTLSLVALGKTERDVWVRGIMHLISNTRNFTYALTVNRWLLREFRSLDRNGSNTLGLGEVKKFLQKANTRCPNPRVRAIFNEVDRARAGYINFDGFQELYRMFLSTSGITEGRFDMYLKDGQNMTLHGFQEFLLNEQAEARAADIGFCEDLMISFFGGRPAGELYFTLEWFVDFLFSKHNSLFNPDHGKLFQDMNRPLSQYWIASSHNTYLTGDQFQSESSCEAYARCLRSGCRCIELDCWDGPDGNPIIFHGHTLTTKIKFKDVLKTIKEHAFVSSPFPLILSIENHCCLQQQKVMARDFKETFGDMLLMQPVDPNAEMLPSPTVCRKKIIIKHKKLPPGVDEKNFTLQPKSVEDMELSEMMDLSDSIKQGYLLLEDPVDKEWNRHYFVLTPHSLYFTHAQEKTQEETEAEEVIDEEKDREMHYNEKWFHGKLAGGRITSERLLKDFNGPDGSFLVRESDTFMGDYTLSFCRRGRVNHCRIRSRTEDGRIKMYLTDNVSFDNLYALIEHYRRSPLKAADFEMSLTEPVPQPKRHEEKPWFHKISRQDAEDMLKKVREDGAFLIRQSQTAADAYAVSFRAEHKIKHCRIHVDGRLYTIGTAQFESLSELVEYYEKHPLYRKMKLKYPINEQILMKIGVPGEEDDEDQPLYEASVYHDPNAFTQGVTVRALYDYRAQRADELSFCKHALIINVEKHDGGWWKGDYNGMSQRWFPSNYVEEVEMEAAKESPLGSVQQGSVDVHGCHVETANTRSEQPFIFRIMPANAIGDRTKQLEVAAEGAEDLSSWVSAIRDATQNAADKKRERTLLEQKRGIAQELSDLVVYCRTGSNFDLDGMPGKYYEMASFSETKVERILKTRASRFVTYNFRQHSRIYPKGSRVDSSNYDPTPMWNCGVQMCALNYQTPDKPMQLNYGRFLSNGGCGYVLQPECMRDPAFDPAKRESVNLVEPVALSIVILGARNLVKFGRGISSPFVEIDIVGLDCDTQKYKTPVKPDNGLNPVWNLQCEFDIENPDMALIRFQVQDEDMFGDPNFLGQAVYPISSLRRGYRSVILRNGYNEELELSRLLVHVDTRNAKGDDEDLYSSIQGLRHQMARISSEISQEAKQNKKIVANGRVQSETSVRKLERLSEELRKTQGLLFENQMKREKQRQDQKGGSARTKRPVSTRVR
ncbi:1-phosphatidylinositol 4,5-bisphosphate phosphodiesterase gamma-1-like isoform X2 [Corticium candelabrum]|uniref:1-phosphatidylinositol 4,5-bisphosphate phosphodiesterase gamma-1-like isoform X2 n=1 Tax=Corticium candelabrum TaxID=121492 RepID=UPI002E2632D8|nr:1-phosphatidylinositol 4,5-bisphosphate phosphodiesterase gamma-1-like isoform X2 [Corticium candelabrum]